MPSQTSEAVSWALTQTITFMDDTFAVTKDNIPALVDKVREYFNTNNIDYTTFSYDDLKPYLV